MLPVLKMLFEEVNRNALSIFFFFFFFNLYQVLVSTVRGNPEKT